MSKFKRGITDKDFISALNRNEYWQQMVKDEDLFIAIRDNYLNVYYYGQSICKVNFVNKKIKWTSHKKYLGVNESGYADTGIYLEKIEELKQNARKHGGKEKEQVKKNILDNKQHCILDVEITFGREDGYNKRSIDYLAVEKGSRGKIKLVFYEAKHFDNSEIRARAIPKVFEQIDKYESALNDTNHREEILNSYKTIYENIKALNLNNKNNLVHLIGADFSKLEIDTKPRLIIFAIDKEKMNDIHILKLKEKFSDRLILKEKLQ